MNITFGELNGPYLSKVESLSLKGVCAIIGWYWFSSSWFLIPSMNFRNSVIKSPLKTTWPFIWKKVNPLHPRMFYAKLVKLAQWFRRRFLNSFDEFLQFRYYLRLEKGMVLHLYKIKFPLPDKALCQVWSKLALLFWRRRFLNFVNEFSQFHQYLPFE